MAAEGDRVAVRCAHRGTHLGDFLGVPATGKPVAITATGIYIVKDGKLVQNQVIFDAFGLLQQVGVVP
jgi:predicted ester cyclase